MRTYGKMFTGFWTEGKGVDLRGDVLALAIAPYVFACPHGNMIGLYYLPIAYIAHDLGISTEDASKGLARVCDAGLLEHDRSTDGVFVFGAAKRNIGASLKPGDKQRVGIQSLLESMRRHPFLQDFLDRYAKPYGVNVEALGRTIEAPPKPGTVAVAVAEEVTVAGAGACHPSQSSTTVIPGQPLPDRIAKIYRDVSANTDLGEISATWTQRQRDAIREMSAWCGGDLAKLRTELELLRGDQWLARQPVHIWASRIGTGDSVSKNGGKGSGAKDRPKVSDESKFTGIDTLSDSLASQAKKTGVQL